MAPSCRLIVQFDDERDLKYVPFGTHPPTPASKNTRGTPKKVTPGVVTASQSNEECILTSTCLGLRRVLREHQVPRRFLVQSQPTLQGRRRLQPTVPDHREPLFPQCLV